MASDNPSSSFRLTMPRRNSLRLLPQPPDSIPIPPSLRQSPYLNAPIFKTEIPSPALPTEEDEKWLQDTVPITSPNPNALSMSSSAKAQADRRGSIKQPPSRHFSNPPSIAVSPCDSTPSSPHPGARGQSQSHTQKYLAHSLAPPPMYGGCSSPGSLNGWYTSSKSPPMNSKPSEANSPRTNASPCSDQGYFPRVPPMR